MDGKTDYNQYRIILYWTIEHGRNNTKKQRGDPLNKVQKRNKKEVFPQNKKEKKSLQVERSRKWGGERSSTR